MKSKTLMTLLVSIVLLLSPAAAYAHTGLQSSNPAKGETIDKPLNEIRMEFNTDIEPLSTFEIKNDKNESFKVTSINVAKSTMSGKLDPALPNGEYTVTWKIIGRDGHPVENKFSFTVKLAQQEAPRGTEPVNDSGETKKPQQAAAPEPAASSNDGGKTWIAAAVLVAAALLIVSLRVLRRKK